MATVRGFLIRSGGAGDDRIRNVACSGRVDSGRVHAYKGERLCDCGQSESQTCTHATDARMAPFKFFMKSLRTMLVT